MSFDAEGNIKLNLSFMCKKYVVSLLNIQLIYQLSTRWIFLLIRY